MGQFSVTILAVAGSILSGNQHLEATLTAIANGHPQSRIDDLLPWNFKPSS